MIKMERHESPANTRVAVIPLDVLREFLADVGPAPVRERSSQPPASIVTLVVPIDAFPERYDPRTHLRVSPDIERYMADGVWYNAKGIRDEVRSPKQDLIKINVGRILHPETHPDFLKPTRREYLK